jgi:HSP20 family protein
MPPDLEVNLMLMRFDPFRELDRLAQQTVGSASSGRWTGMPMDGYRHGDRYTLHFDLPGVDPATVDLTIEKNVLTVTAERRWQPEEGVDVLVSERPQGRFSRQIFLGDGLDPDRIEANYDAGVLTVHIPLAEQAKPRKVEIQSAGSGPRAIDAESTAA